MARKRVVIDALEVRCDLFGKSAWSAGLGEASFTELHGTKKVIRERIRDECPDFPGVYGMLDAEGHVVYVGMSNQLPKRLQSYFSDSNKRRKENRIRRRSVGVLWQPVAHPFLARLRERQLIRRFSPCMNIQSQPVRMRTGYIIADLHEAPSFQLVSEIPREHGGVWGPVPYHGFSKTAVEQLNFHFSLRDCPKQTVMQFRRERREVSFAPPTCLRLDLQTCLAPCAGSCTRSEYTRQFNHAKKFLSGASQTLFEKLDREMHEAASDRLFEKAARLRDRKKGFEYLDSHLRRFHDWSSQASFIYRLQSNFDHSELWLIVIRGMIVDLIQKPCLPEEKATTATLIEQARQQHSGSAAVKNVTQPGEFEIARSLYHWFKKSPEEVKRQYTLRKALSLCLRKKKKAS